MERKDYEVMIMNIELIEYATGKFKQEKYDEALDAFVLAYTKGYQQEWVLKTIYDCYMEGNQQEFQSTYENQNASDLVKYEETVLDFIPYREGEYYIFDKEEMYFRGKLSIKSIEQAELNPELKKMEFSAVATEIMWDLRKIKDIVTDAKTRKVYIVCGDLRRVVSYCKIPELVEYMENIRIFANWEQFQNYFHQHTEIYLPKIFCGTENTSQIFYNIIQREHEYRLTPEGRNTENVLLTIAIPTANRGHLLLKRIEHLVKMQYDSEIEIAISKNGTTFFEEEYKKASQIQDARFNYYDHGKEIKYNINWAYAVQMSHGRYVVLISDEDDIIFEAMEHYMKLFMENPNLSLVRAKSNFQGYYIVERRYGKKGIEAFEYEFLSQNYLSGLIVKRETFLQANLLELERFSKNVFYRYYPHEWWCAKLSLKGDYMAEPVSLIAEGNSILVEEIKRYRDAGIIGEDEGTVGTSELPQYATYESRIEQFKGQVEFLKIFGERDKRLITVGLNKAICKSFYLLELARSYNYNCDDYINKIEEFTNLCVDIIEGMEAENEKKKELLIHVKNWCIEAFNMFE